MKYRQNLSGQTVFTNSTAFDLYALTTDTFYGVALPAVVVAIVTRWAERSSIPDEMFDMKNVLASKAEGCLGRAAGWVL